MNLLKMEPWIFLFQLLVVLTSFIEISKARKEMANKLNNGPSKNLLTGVERIFLRQRRQAVDGRLKAERIKAEKIMSSNVKSKSVKADKIYGDRIIADKVIVSAEVQRDQKPILSDVKRAFTSELRHDLGQTRDDKRETLKVAPTIPGSLPIFGGESILQVLPDNEYTYDSKSIQPKESTKPYVGNGVRIEGKSQNGAPRALKMSNFQWMGLNKNKREQTKDINDFQMGVFHAKSTSTHDSANRFVRNRNHADGYLPSPFANHEVQLAEKFEEGVRKESIKGKALDGIIKAKRISS